MGSARVPVFWRCAWRHGGHDIDARLAVRQCFVHGEAGDGVLVQLSLNVDAALPDEFAQLVLDLLSTITVHLGQQLRIGQERGDIAIPHAVELQIGMIDIDRHEWDAAARGSRKHEVVAGKANGAGAVAHVNVEIDLLFQRLFHGGWQTGAEGDLVSLPMRQTFDADFTTLGFERLRRSAVQRHEGRVVGILHQRFGKLDTGARCYAVGVDRIVDDAEALAGAKVVIGRPRLGNIRKGKACLVGVQRRTIILALLEGLSQPVERSQAGALCPAKLVGIKRCGRCLAQNLVIVLDLRLDGREFRPQGAILRIER